MRLRMLRRPAHFQNSHDLGAWGEEIAVRYLCDHGYRILERNYRCPAGEIDIIAEYADTIHFVEVKTRAHEQTDLFRPEDAVDDEKRRHIRNSARHYLKRWRQPSPSCFSVVSIVLRPTGELAQLEYRPNAFGWEE